MRSRAFALVTVGIAAAALFIAPTAAEAKTAKPSISAVSPAYGKTKGGTKVTITGKNFTKGVKVKFGTTLAKSVKLVSKTKLTVITPKHSAGNVHIRVITKAGTSAKSDADLFDFQQPLNLSAIRWTSASDAVTGVAFTLPGKIETDTHTVLGTGDATYEIRSWAGVISDFAQCTATVETAKTGTLQQVGLQTASTIVANQFKSLGATHLAISDSTPVTVNGYGGVQFDLAFDISGVPFRMEYEVINTTTAQVTMNCFAASPIVTDDQLIAILQQANASVTIPANI
jgi:hypothetical protein